MAVTLRGSFVQFASLFVVACFVAVRDAGAHSHTANVPLLRFPDLPKEFYEARANAKAAAQEGTSQYAIVIDAGSSGCRIHVYSYAWNKTSADSPTVLAVTVNGETWSQKGPLSINSFANNPQNVSQALTPLITQAQKWISDNTTWADTPMWLKATAGMRLLPQNQQDEIMKYVREYLATTPFDFRSAEVIPGWQEGAFAWITVNYLDNKLGHPSTEGALDLGGASTQIVYVPTSSILESSSSILVGTGNNYTYTVYAYSYNGYGLDSVWLTALQAIISQNPNQTVIQTPCLPAGVSIFAGNTSFKDIVPPSLQNSNLTFNGTGNLTECTEVVMGQFYPNTSCAANFASACSGIKGTYQTAIPDSYGFRAFSGYTYTRDWIVTNMGITGNQGYDIYVAGYNAMFAKTYEELVAYGPTNTVVARFPFNAIYIAKLLEALKLTNNSATPLDIAANMVNSQNVSLSVGWTLGAMVYEIVNDLTPVFPPPSPPGGKKPPFWVWIIIGVAAAIFVLVIIIAAVGVARRRKEAAKDPDFTLPGPHH